MNDRVQISLRLPEKLREELQRQADAMGVSVNALIMIFIDRGLKDRQGR